MIARHKKKINYLLVAGFNTVVGLSAFPILFYALASQHLHYMSILLISQVLCVISAFFTNKYLVFRTKGNHFSEFLKFSTFYMAYFLVNLILMPVLVEVAGIHPAVSQVFISIGIIISSFYWHSKVTFTTKKESSS